MIKRPLVWVLGAYIAGMSLAYGSISIRVVILMMLPICLILYLLMYRVPNQLMNRNDMFLWSLPVLLLFGYVVMEGQMTPPAADQAFSDKAECRLEGEVIMVIRKQSCRVLYVNDNTIDISGKGKYRCENVIVYCSDSQKYLIGNKITVYGEIHKFSTASNPGQFNEKLYYQSKNVDYKVMADTILINDCEYSGFHAILSGIRERLLLVYHMILNSREAGILSAMLLGENYLVDEEITKLYQENGISHMLSISGLHISFIGMFIITMLKKCRVSPVPSSLLAIVLIFGYGLLTNFSVATNRSVVMMMVLLFGQMIGRTYDMISASALSALFILLNQPLQILNAGFLLSFGAVLGIAVILPCLRILFPTQNKLWQGLFVSISVEVVTLPVILDIFYQFPTYSVFINLFLLPCASTLLLSGIIAGTAGAVFLPAGVFLVGGASCILKYYEWICQWGSSLPGNLITTGKPGELRIVLYFMLLGIFVWRVNHKDKPEPGRMWLLLLLGCILLMFVPHRKAGFAMTLLDVGQGDGIFMETSSGGTYLIDGGSADVGQVGTYRLTPFLLSRGVDRIDYAFVSHTDTDHISGLMELMENGKVKISRLVLPDIVQKEESYEKLEKLARQKKIEVQYIKAGDRLQDGKMKLLCLHPFLKEQYSSANEYSAVLQVSYGSFDMLLTGDLEGKGEKLLMQLLQSPQMRAEYGLEECTGFDVLKVAHHGSKNATLDDFLRIIRPCTALISCGRGNRYGHPHRELLDRLHRMGCKTGITFETGAITVSTDGEHMKIRYYR